MKQALLIPIEQLEAEEVAPVPQKRMPLPADWRSILQFQAKHFRKQLVIENGLNSCWQCDPPAKAQLFHGFAEACQRCDAQAPWAWQRMFAFVGPNSTFPLPEVLSVVFFCSNRSQKFQLTEKKADFLPECVSTCFLHMPLLWRSSGGSPWQSSSPSRSLQSEAHLIGVRIGSAFRKKTAFTDAQIEVSLGQCRDTNSTNPNLLGEDARQDLLLVAERRSTFEGNCRECRGSSNTVPTRTSHKESSQCDGT